MQKVMDENHMIVNTRNQVENETNYESDAHLDGDIVNYDGQVIKKTQSKNAQVQTIYQLRTHERPNEEANNEMRQDTISTNTMFRIANQRLGVRQQFIVNC